MIDSYISSLLTTFIAKRAADDRPIQDTMNQPQMAEAIKDVPAGTYPPGSWPRGTRIVYDPRSAESVGGADNLQNQQGIQMRQDGSVINPLEGTAWRPPGQGDTGGVLGNAAVAGGAYAGIKALQNWRTLLKPYSKWTPAERQTYVQGTVENLAKGKDAPIATAVNTTPKGGVAQLPAFPMTPPAKPSKPGAPGTPPTSATPPAAAAGILDSMRRAGISPGGTDISVTGTPQTPGKLFSFQRSPSPATSSTKLTRGPAWANALRPGVTSRGAGGNRWGAAAAALAPSVIGGTMAMFGKDMFGNDVETNPDGGYWGVLPRSSSPVGKPLMVPAPRVRIPDPAADTANAKKVEPPW